MSGLPTAPDTEVGFQPPPMTLPIGKSPYGALPPPMAPVPGDEEPTIFNPIMIMLCGYLSAAHPGALEKAVANAYKKIPDFMNDLKVKDERSFLIFANDLLKWIPHENYKGRDIYNIITMFYFIFEQEPLRDLQTPITPESVGQPLTWLSSWIVVFSQLIGLHMDSRSSLTRESLITFKKSPLYCYNDAVEPRGGFKTFNEFFCRKLKEGVRPIDSPKDDHIIVYPADCTFDSVEKGGKPTFSISGIGLDNVVDIKGLKWTIDSLLQGSAYAHEFKGGIWMHAFLNTYNYHRQHAPVRGTVMEAKNIQGACYLEVNEEKCEPIRTMCGTDAPDFPGYQFLQTRGMVIIDNPLLGLVAVLPIGMAQVSSVKLAISEGDYVNKGDEISHFEFGGSDIICVFQKKAGLELKNFKHSSNGKYSHMGSLLATAPQDNAN